LTFQAQTCWAMGRGGGNCDNSCEKRREPKTKEWTSCHQLAKSHATRNSDIRRKKKPTVNVTHLNASLHGSAGAEGKEGRRVKI